MFFLICFMRNAAHSFFNFILFLDSLNSLNTISKLFVVDSILNSLLSNQHVKHTANNCRQTSMDKRAPRDHFQHTKKIRNAGTWFWDEFAYVRGSKLQTRNDPEAVPQHISIRLQQQQKLHSTRNFISNLTKIKNIFNSQKFLSSTQLSPCRLLLNGSIK